MEGVSILLQTNWGLLVVGGSQRSIDRDPNTSKLLQLAVNIVKVEGK